MVHQIKLLTVCIFTCKVSVSLEQPGNVLHASWQVLLGAKGFGYEQSLQVITDVN